MVTQIPAYQCERCEKVFYGSDSAAVSRAALLHERKPITGVLNSIDGLVVKQPQSGYHVCINSGHVNFNHKALYVWNIHDMHSFELIKPITIEDIAGDNLNVLKALHDLQSFVGTFTGFEASNARDHLYMRSSDSGNSDRYPAFRELDKKELAMVSKVLSKKFPEIYGKTEFKNKAYPKR